MALRYPRFTLFDPVFDKIVAVQAETINYTNLSKLSNQDLAEVSGRGAMWYRLKDERIIVWRLIELTKLDAMRCEQMSIWDRLRREKLLRQLEERSDILSLIIRAYA